MNNTVNLSTVKECLKRLYRYEKNPEILSDIDFLEYCVDSDQPELAHAVVSRYHAEWRAYLSLEEEVEEEDV